MCKKHSTGPTNEHGGCAIAQTGMTQQPLAKVDLQCRVYKLTGDPSLLHCSMRVGYRRHETGRQIGGPVCYRPRSFNFGKSWLAAWPPPRGEKKKKLHPPNPPTYSALRNRSIIREISDEVGNGREISPSNSQTSLC